MKKRTISVVLIAALGLAACTTVPTGPSRMALPGSGKNFDDFRIDDVSCRQFALDSSGATPTQTQENAAVKSAAVGTAIGAVAGAAIGGSSHGAAAGAGVGLLMGALAGAAAGDQSAYVVQRRYDNSYVQCMYAKGHRVPVSGNMATAPRPVYSQPATQPVQPYYAPPPAPAVQPAPQAYYPPPPPGSAPPPPSAIVR